MLMYMLLFGCSVLQSGFKPPILYLLLLFYYWLNFQFTVHVVFFVSLTPWFWRSTSFWVSLWAVRFSQSLISVHFWSRASIIFRHCFLELHHFPTYLHIDVMKGDCQKMLSFFFSFTIKVHLGCVYSGLVISRETFCFNELLWFEDFFCYLIM